MMIFLCIQMIFTQQLQGVVFSELMYNPHRATLGRDDDMEWIELYNRGESPANLAGMMISDGGNQLFLDSFILESGCYAVVCANEESFRNAYGDHVDIVSWTGSWTKMSNSGDDMVLYGNDGTVIESVAYSDQWGSPDGEGRSPADGLGSSLERIDPWGPNDETNWQPSRDFSNPTRGADGEAVCWGTPGAANSVAR
jgi:hypothetical protein